jgi:hypothetical protein
MICLVTLETLSTVPSNSATTGLQERQTLGTFA